MTDQADWLVTIDAPWFWPMSPCRFALRPVPDTGRTIRCILDSGDGCFHCIGQSLDSAHRDLIMSVDQPRHPWSSIPEGDQESTRERFLLLKMFKHRVLNEGVHCAPPKLRKPYLPQPV